MDYLIEKGTLIGWYGDQHTIQEAVIPEGVKKIGAEAFKDCYELKHVVLPESLTHIQRGAFGRCHSLEEIQLPDSVESIGGKAFYQCKSLKRIRIPEGVKRICHDTFSMCERLEEVQFPESLTRISIMAFFACENLTKLKIPDNVCKVSKEAFQCCRSLHEISYRGITFYPDAPAYQYTNIENLFGMIAQRNFSAGIRRSAKYDIMFRLFFQNPQDTEISNYIKANFTPMFRTLIDAENLEFMQKIFDMGTLITRRNVDGLIRYAIDTQKHQCQLLLMQYKDEHIGYHAPNFKL